MAEDLKLRVLTDGDTRGVDKAAAALDGLARDADRAEKSTKGLGDEVDKTGKKTEGLGQRSKRTSHDIVDLDKRIVELKASLKSLNEEHERSGKLDRKKFGSDTRELSALQRMKKQLEGLGDETGRWSGLLDTVIGKIPLVGGLGKLMGNPAAGIVAASIAVPAVIGAGATAGGLITAGVGAGVAGAGIAGAAMQSEKVRAEWARTTSEIKARFLDATTSFEGPTVSAISKIRQALLDVDAKKIFGDASKFVEPLATGAAAAVRLIGQGVEYLVAHGQPAIEAIGGVVAQVGGAVKIAFEQIGGGAEGGGKAIRDLGTAISDTIIVTGYWIGWLEDAYDALDKVRNAIADVHPVAGLMRDLWTDDAKEAPKVIARRLDDVSSAADHAGGSTRYLSGGLADMTSEANLANEAFDRLFGIMMDVDTANLRVKQGMADLTKTVREGGASHDELTEKVLSQIRALEEQRNAQLATGDGSQAATDRINANYNAQLEQLKKMFPWLAALIQKYEDLAKPITKTVTVNIRENVSVSNQGVISGGDLRRMVGGAYASGTSSARAGWALVGEDGPELVNFGGGEKVLTADNTSRAMSGMGTTTGYGAGGRTVTFAGNTDSAFASAFMKLVQTGSISID